MTPEIGTEEKADRFNEGKLRWNLVDFKALEPMVRVLEMGAKKYSDHNWKKGLDQTEILNSMERHLIEIFNGSDRDPESNDYHMAHIMCNCMFWLHNKIKEDT